MHFQFEDYKRPYLPIFVSNSLLLSFKTFARATSSTPNLPHVILDQMAIHSSSLILQKSRG
ncbi:unnamed protein product [Hymenolepis diminuta]|uniref:Uncharacterized protein n=1 Tax=Hymenolepis diminuta TaxID=6216 RepID=A0A564Y9V9_HYMDI|nr:unnamed protein product [Hymenolepis diminuta]